MCLQWQVDQLPVPVEWKCQVSTRHDDLLVITVTVTVILVTPRVLTRLSLCPGESPICCSIGPPVNQGMWCGLHQIKARCTPVMHAVPCCAVLCKPASLGSRLSLSCSPLPAEKWLSTRCGSPRASTWLYHGGQCHSCRGERADRIHSH